MNYLKINQDNTRTEINVSDNVIETIYQNVKDYETHDPDKLIGRIDIDHGYQDAITFLNSNYPKFRCVNLLEPYVRFEDPKMEALIVNRLYTYKDGNPIGNGIGATATDLSKPTEYWFFDTIQGNTEITKFNEFRYMTNFKNITGSYFNNCTNLCEIDLSNIEKIYNGNNAFNSTKIKNVNLPICTNISMDHTFYNCSELTDFYAPLAMGTLGPYFFEGCSSLVNVDISNIQLLMNGSFKNCSSLATLNIPHCTGKINNETFNGCTNLQSLTIGSITEVGSSSFKNCSSLIEIDLSNCTIIANEAFNGCSSLTTLGDTTNITQISNYCFEGCNSLTGTLDLSNADYENNQPTGIFYNCSGLTKIKLGHFKEFARKWNSYTSPERRMFYGCTNLVTIDVKQLDYALGNGWAFGNNLSLRNVIIRNNENIPEIHPESTKVTIDGFGGTNVKVYVVDEMLDIYKNATGWENMRSYLYPLSEYVEE